MSYNSVISVENITDESGVFEEPVSLDEMKDYLRLEGYVDDDESTADDLSDFDFDDRLLTELITASRESIEKGAGISIIPKTLEAILSNPSGMIEIPQGPVMSIVSLYNENDIEVISANYKVVGNEWKFLKYPCDKFLKITYEAGYVELPKPLKIDIMRLTAYMYENRGDDASINQDMFHRSQENI